MLLVGYSVIVKLMRRGDNMADINDTTNGLIEELQHRFEKAKAMKITSGNIAYLQQEIAANDYVILLKGNKRDDNPLRSD